jgi:uncharacterized protein with ParB-like and HNH nuclease domain
VVVKRRPDGSWELVDGQQRLTTILLILACQKDLVKALRKPGPVTNLVSGTRAGYNSQPSFLTEIRAWTQP